MKRKKFKGKYRIESSRHPWWDYSNDGFYFLTINTLNRKRHFGHIKNGKMILSEIGQIVYDVWLDLPNHLEYITLDQFVVMPDHIHGIIQIRNSNRKKTIETGASKWKPGCLGVIVNQFKRSCTIRARKIDASFAWQSRYHDWIIRSTTSLNNIRKYIADNPKKAPETGVSAISKGKKTPAPGVSAISKEKPV